MAVISYTTTRSQEDQKYLVTWENVTENDTCLAFLFNEHSKNICVEADDTSAWGGSTLTMVGSNGGGGIACKAMDDSTSSWTANALFSIRERPSQITPTFAGGTSQSVTVHMVVWL